ncbi:LicD family protein [Bacillus spongiae]|uniref:LicD family protein n=1 Tax=Bacillus spongiae TaxID=2683610 RepID=A0ABU8HDY2_9BACI
MKQDTIQDVQKKILEIMKFIDKVCRENDIDYYIMGGTALGAVRHEGFIPWDDDLDIFMTPKNYEKFKRIFNQLHSEKYALQEWRIVDEYLEYAKIRMNGTTFIEEHFKDRKEMHHGIYVDIMILHKCPTNPFIQRAIYYASKFVTLHALSQRNWKPKSLFQSVALQALKILPNKFFSKQCYKLIYKYQNRKSDYVYNYFITKANFTEGIFEREIFEEPVDIPFESIKLKGPTEIKKYLKHRYGDYMKLPSIEQQELSIHAEIYDTRIGFEHYINN